MSKSVPVPILKASIAGEIKHAELILSESPTNSETG